MHRAFMTAAVAAGPTLAWLFSAAVASADDVFSYGDFGITPGAVVVPPVADGGFPGIDEQTVAYQDFNFVDAVGGGSFEGEVKAATDVVGWTNEEIIVQAGNESSGLADGSIFDTFNYGDGISLDYYDIPSGLDAGAAEFLVTPLGDINLLPPDLVAELPSALFIPALALFG